MPGWHDWGSELSDWHVDAPPFFYLSVSYLLVHVHLLFAHMTTRGEERVHEDAFEAQSTFGW